MTHPPDQRTLDQLINVALCEADEDAVWQAVYTLQRRGDREVLERADELSVSNCFRERELAAWILGDLGAPERIFRRRCLQILTAMLQPDEEPSVLASVLTAVSHYEHRLVSQVVSCAGHADAGVRLGVVNALSGQEDPQAIAGLISLSSDPEVEVRDWATFGLGTLTDVDTPVLRAALAARLDDPDLETRLEAILGLARRRDERVCEIVAQELTAPDVCDDILEAAENLADQRLHPLLLALQEPGRENIAPLERAIAACAPCF
ncbi:HEAT repeat domain-containing protein [Lignipirellula cremea]|uniref:Putative lyase n=1 Tax=Lignipirellula cremea TaxID=2528010 RepID=A0A518DP40_9BACT|nr:HEAT repeat domain-containing protein [Lignipirellula cremea]QDU93604.1 putative lyase [Lignipirellula cremea]